MRKSLLPLLLLLPATAFAASPECRHSQPRQLQLDLAGVKTVVFDIGAHDLVVESVAGAKPSLNGKACASVEKSLPCWKYQLSLDSLGMMNCSASGGLP